MTNRKVLRMIPCFGLLSYICWDGGHWRRKTRLGVGCNNSQSSTLVLFDLLEKFVTAVSKCWSVPFTFFYMSLFYFFSLPKWLTYSNGFKTSIPDSKYLSAAPVSALNSGLCVTNCFHNISSWRLKILLMF